MFSLVFPIIIFYLIFFYCEMRKVWLRTDSVTMRGKCLSSVIVYATKTLWSLGILHFRTKRVEGQQRQGSDNSRPGGGKTRTPDGSSIGLSTQSVWTFWECWWCCWRCVSTFIGVCFYHQPRHIHSLGYLQCFMVPLQHISLNSFKSSKSSSFHLGKV